MSSNPDFSTTQTQEEFLNVFKGLCAIAEVAFNEFEQDFKDKRLELYGFKEGISYLMGITFVISGMRGNYMQFRSLMAENFFSVTVGGVTYDQPYLYKMENYFIDRFNRVLKLLEERDPEHHKVVSKVWGTF